VASFLLWQGEAGSVLLFQIDIIYIASCISYLDLVLSQHEHAQRRLSTLLLLLSLFLLSLFCSEVSFVARRGGPYSYHKYISFILEVVFHTSTCIFPSMSTRSVGWAHYYYSVADTFTRRGRLAGEPDAIHIINYYYHRCISFILVVFSYLDLILSQHEHAQRRLELVLILLLSLLCGVCALCIVIVCIGDTIRPYLDLVLSQHEHAQRRHRVHARDAKDLVVGDGYLELFTLLELLSS